MTSSGETHGTPPPSCASGHSGPPDFRRVRIRLALALSGVTGYHVAIPLLNYAGAVVAPEFAWKVAGALVFSVLTFVLLAVLAGPFLILLDVRQAVRSIEARLERGEVVRKSHHYERREPSIEFPEDQSRSGTTRPLPGRAGEA
jgi:hypothetical protein